MAEREGYTPSAANVSSIKGLQRPQFESVYHLAPPPVNSRDGDGRALSRTGEQHVENAPLAAMSREGLAGVVVKTGSAPPLPTQGVAFSSTSESHLSKTVRGGSARLGRHQRIHVRSRLPERHHAGTKQKTTASPAGVLRVERAADRQRLAWEMRPYHERGL